MSSLEPTDETGVIEDAPATEIVEEAEAPPPRPPLIWPWLLALLLLMLAGGLAYVLATRGEDRTIMPRVVGLTEPQARALLEERDLEVDVERRQGDRAAGIVFAQVPGQGTQLGRGQQVEILVSTGLEQRPVPDVRGLEADDAIGRVENAGFEVDVRPVFASAPEGRVVEQDPRPGERVAVGSTVALVVSRGPRTETTAETRAAVPDVAGLTQTRALVQLLRVGLVGAVVYADSDAPFGEVIGVRPAPGTSVARDSQVRITVSAGRDVPRVSVPDVVGSTEDDTRQQVRDAGFRVGVIRTGDGGTVRAQQPGGGTAAPDGAVVTLFVD